MSRKSMEFRTNKKAPCGAFALQAKETPALFINYDNQSGNTLSFSITNKVYE
jgi:hypothetical protein